jgi:hypothetical protein
MAGRPGFKRIWRLVSSRKKHRVLQSYPLSQFDVGSEEHIDNLPILRTKGMGKSRMMPAAYHGIEYLHEEPLHRGKTKWLSNELFSSINYRVPSDLPTAQYLARQPVQGNGAF